MNQLISTTRQIEQGLIFIPDISGFTELVHTTDPETGGQITSALLSVLIEQNLLQMQVAEIEGDAILFYRLGAAPGYRELQQQYEVMSTAFEKKRMELERFYNIAIHVSLKAIAHYGSMTAYSIGTFEKLYGRVVVEAHRLLKNSIHSGRYLLLTESLLNKMDGISEKKSFDFQTEGHQLCERYESLRHICFTYFDYSEVREELVA